MNSVGALSQSNELSKTPEEILATEQAKDLAAIVVQVVADKGKRDQVVLVDSCA
jgi:hypothetical protein